MIVEAVEGRIANTVVIDAPPRHGKSELVSRWLPAWYLMNYPKNRVILASYAAEFARNWGRKARDIVSEWAPMLSHRAIISRVTSAATDWETISGGGMATAGALGPLTGRGANCVSGSCIISTEFGPMKAQELWASPQVPMLWSYDHESGRRVLRRVVAMQRTVGASGLVSIVTKSGRVIDCTRDHKFFVYGRGYLEASSLREGDKIQQERWETLPVLWSAEGCKEPFDVVRCVLSKGEKLKRQDMLRTMQPRVRDQGLRSQESDQERQREVVLFSRLLESLGIGSSRWPVQMREQDQQAGAFLLEQVQVGLAGRQKGSSKRKANSRMQDVWGDVYQTPPWSRVLLEELLKQNALSSHGWEGELELSQREQLFQVVQGDGEDRQRARRPSMRRMQFSRELDRPSLGREHCKQLAGESGDAMQALPCGSPQIPRFTVYGDDPTSSLEVFDFQVEGTSNFFADGLLAHNCLIIDDPIKNDKQALSKTFRDQLWDWWQSTAETRLEPRGVAIVMATRWHNDDLSGRLLDQARKGDRAPVVHVHLPAIAEEGDIIGRQTGEALWPERWPIETLEERRRKLDPFWWSALYQGRPTRSGKMRFPDEYFESIWINTLPDRFDFTVMAVDPSMGKDSKKGDYAAVVWLGASGGKLYCQSMMGRWPTPQLCGTVIGKYQKLRPDALGLEGNAWQHLLANEMDRVCHEKGIAPLPVELIYNRIAKETRIERLGGLLSRGLIKFAPTQGNKLLVDQLREFPHGEHDDGPDALEMAVRLMQQVCSAQNGGLGDDGVSYEVVG